LFLSPIKLRIGLPESCIISLFHYL
jgi:hypothetical protein